MKKSSRPNLHLALVHYPVVNKSGETIASAVTNLDIHDISRAAETYGARSFYMVTPLTDQTDLVRTIVRHWTSGNGATYNPKRRQALELIRMAEDLKQVTDDIRKEGERPRVVVTSARKGKNTVGYAGMRRKIADGRPYLLVFGTGWGLASEVIEKADFRLEPVRGKTDYNHLSVRSATAIILDRLLGCDR